MTPVRRTRRRRKVGLRLTRARVLRVGALILLGLVVAVVLFVASFRWIDPPVTAFMLQDSAPEVEHEWVEWVDISRHVPIAVVAAEDQKFPEHRGFDLESIRSAFEENQERRRPRGASTISQQVAKNLFLWPGQSYVRKGLEAALTVLIESTWSKRRILEVFLNVAQLGPGLYGVGAASERYFSKPASAIEPGEAAILAAVLPNPVRLTAAEPSEYVQGRAEDIAEQVRLLGGAGYLDKLEGGARLDERLGR